MDRSGSWATAHIVQFAFSAATSQRKSQSCGSQKKPGLTPCGSLRHGAVHLVSLVSVTGSNLPNLEKERIALPPSIIAAKQIRKPSAFFSSRLPVAAVCVLLQFCSVGETLAQELNATESELLFVRRVGPILRAKCLGCHGKDPAAVEGALDVSSLQGLHAGGDSGEASIVNRKPEDSPLYLAATRQNENWSPMPPKEAERLTPEQLAWVKDWIASGAAWPNAERAVAIETEYQKAWSAEDGIPVKTSGGLDSDWTNRKYDVAGLWAYQPIVKPDVSLLQAAQETAAGHASDAARSTDPIDILIAEALPLDLPVACRTDRRTLIRRATFDLTGLPPTPQDVADFVNDSQAEHEAFATVLERLLNSPHYGERMAQHWLDVVRYADSSGFANDFERGNAWRYRDYVIRSFNGDKPFDQFIKEQIAGDEIDPDNPENLVATGFLRMGPWELTGMEVARIARQRFLDDVTNSVGEAFLGHCLQCARCHDHKFDPVPTRDYYSIQAVFATTQLAERSAKFLPQENTTGFDEQLYLQKAKKQYSDSRKNLDDALVANAATWWTQKHGADNKEWQTAVEQATGKNDVFKAAIKVLQAKGFDESELPSKLDCYTPEQFGKERVVRKGLQRLAWEFDRYLPFALSVYNGHTPQVTSVTMPMRLPANTSKGELETSYILTGGDPFTHGEIVRPGILSVVAQQADAHVPDAISGRRLAFANWVADEGNPLTARVIVNRIWQWHFGKAIAGNANNFGSTGARPTHPALLDWLAATFVEGGWSVKSITKQIMLSDAYCRSSDWPVEAAVTADQHELAARLYAVFEPRRLSAEELRDAMLKVTGELNPVLGGIPCRPEINQEVALQPRQVMGSFASAWIPNPQPERRNRRSVYVLKLRGLVDPMLEVFNAPSPDFSCERRESSTVTPQVFSLFNSTNSHARALALANRVVEETANDSDAVTLCFQLALSRNPTAAERQEVLAHWQAMIKQQPEQAAELEPQPLKVVRKAVEENTGENFAFEETLFSNADYVPDLQPIDCDRRTRALADVCLVILNSNEFVYVY